MVEEAMNDVLALILSALIAAALYNYFSIGWSLSRIADALEKIAKK